MTHYDRNEIGLRPPRTAYDMDARKVVGIALHWPALSRPLDRSVQAVMQAIRNWQDYHMDDLGWSDIGYQLVFDQMGNVYQGRGMMHRSGANGDEYVNERFLAFVLALAPNEKPTNAMVRKVRRYRTISKRIYPRATRLVGHDDIRPEPTACPGSIVSSMIDRNVFRPR